MSTETVTLKDLPSWVAEVVAGYGEVVRKHVVAAAHQARNIIIATIDTTKPFPPVDRGAYRASWQVEEEKDAVLIFSDAPHAPWIERGTRPHMPPVSAIEKWVVRKKLAKGKKARGIAFAIALHIKAKGTPPKKVLNRSMPGIEKLIDEAVGKAVREASEMRAKGLTS